jgi:methylase of polypeptide subunit release factors
MSEETLSPPPPLAFAETVRRVLSGAGFASEGVMARMGGTDFGPRERPRILYATRPGTPLDVLIRMFLLTVPVGESAARAALAPSSLEDWIAAGLLERRDDGIAARFMLTPDERICVLSDLRRLSEQRDFVVGLGPASLLGMSATPRARVARALEIGAGSGGSAVVLARHADTVVSTDINPRALAIAEFNARLNGAPNVAFRLGSLFEPVAGERFDLIVSNPPFAIGPEMELTYRDGGFPLDGFVERLVRGAPAHLNTGGVCVLTANWVEPGGADWRERLLRWTEGSGCDVLFARMSTESPAHYVTAWLAHAERLFDPTLARDWERWTSFLERAGVGAIGAGVVALRRTIDPARTWFLPRVEALDAGGGAALVDALDVFGRLAALDDAGLLAARPLVPTGVALERLAQMGEAGWENGEFVARRLGGLRLSLSLDAPVARLLTRCDGKRTLAELADELARDLAPDDRELAQGALGAVRALLERGLLALA